MSSLAVRFDEAQRRAFRRLLVASGVAHVALALGLAWMPAPRPQALLPGVVTVDLVGLPGLPPAAPAPPVARPKPAPPPPPPEPLPEPEPQAPPKPPPPVEKKVVLPEEPRALPEKKPPAPKPEPATKPAPPAPSKPKEADYEDVLASLRREKGEERPERPEPAGETAARAGSGAAVGRAGVPVSPEVAAWLRAARGHVRQSWFLEPGFRTQILETHLEVRLDAQGNVLGEPRVTRRSGNPWYDESVVRAVQKASPLPAPPEAGRWPFVFRPEDY